MSNKVNPRKKAIDAISQKIAVFIITQTYADYEQDVQQLMGQAIALLDKSVEKMVANDVKADKEETQDSPDL